MWEQGVHRKLLYLPLTFAVNLNLLKKKKRRLKKMTRKGLNWNYYHVSRAGDKRHM